MNDWQMILQLDQERNRTHGSQEELCAAIGRGADLRICTEFRHNEHIDVTSSSDEIIQEVMDFRLTCLLDSSWAAGILTLRQPISLPDGFGDRASMSFFLYNQDATQALARPYLDGGEVAGHPGASPVRAPEAMPKYHPLNCWDGETNAPSTNFIYDFDFYKFMVRDDWEEVLAHDEDGQVRSGRVDDLSAAFTSGREVKVGIGGLCDSLAAEGKPAVPQEVFVHAGSCYHYTEQKLFIASTQPVVRVRPTIPMVYTSKGWDFGWLMVRTDGYGVYRRCDPYTLTFEDIEIQHGMRWFVR
jgi:hypothetical protein